MDAQEFKTALAELGFQNPYWAARALGMTPTHIYRLEKGQSSVTVTVERLIGMYQRYGVPPEWR